MSGFGRRFDPSELPVSADAPPTERADLLKVARELEAFASLERVTPSSDFVDRVMSAVTIEPPPRGTFRSWRAAAVLAGLRSSWRIAWSPARPVAVRAQALAVLLAATLALGSLGSAAAVGAWLLLGEQPSPMPSVELDPPPISPVPSLPAVAPNPSMVPTGPSPVATVTPSPTPEPTPTASGSASPQPTSGASGPTTTTPPPAATPEPGATGRPLETDGPDGTDGPEVTPDPEGTPDPTKTPDPDETPDPTRTPDPEKTPDPEDTPHPTSSPDDD